MAWLRALYAYMAPHVSSDPRAAYVNYIDLDLGTKNGSASSLAVSRARATWGAAYKCPLDRANVGPRHSLIGVQMPAENINRLVRAKSPRHSLIRILALHYFNFGLYPRDVQDIIKKGAETMLQAALQVMSRQGRCIMLPLLGAAEEENNAHNEANRERQGS
ncbi:hypothetical protein EJB05_49734, partial [Eragrostis curvula]